MTRLISKQILPQIDHVVVTVSAQLDNADLQYQKLGFTTTPRGHHSLGTSNHLTIFGTTYLELLGYEPQNSDKIDSRWRFDNGLTGLAFKANQADVLYDALIKQDAPIEGDGPSAFFRPVDLGNGTFPEAHFKIIRFDPTYTPNGQIFFCDQLTPELVWRKAWQKHANGVTNIYRIITEARDPAASIAPLKRTFPTAHITTIEGGLRLEAADKQLDYITPEAAEKLFGDALADRQNEQDRKIALILKTRSLNKVKHVLTKNGVPFIEQTIDDDKQNATPNTAQAKQIVVPAQETFGFVLIFQAE
ncbi:VOC family protein [Orbaceae bacterium ESL0727]|nr:VOC family protein [Orbaceae bacterium ESL0727]